jgi:hypothetical protein
MSFFSNLFFKTIYLAATIGYPGFMIHKNKEKNDQKEQKLWLLYFLILGCLNLLEGTLLFPITFV